MADIKFGRKELKNWKEWNRNYGRIKKEKNGRRETLGNGYNGKPAATDERKYRSFWDFCIGISL